MKSRLLKTRHSSFLFNAQVARRYTKRSSIIRPPHPGRFTKRLERRAISNSSELKGLRGSGVVGPFGCSLHRCRRAVTSPKRQKVRVRVKRTCPRDRRRGGETSQAPKRVPRNGARLSEHAARGKVDGRSSPRDSRVYVQRERKKKKTCQQAEFE